MKTESELKYQIENLKEAIIDANCIVEEEVTKNISKYQMRNPYNTDYIIEFQQKINKYERDIKIINWILTDSKEYYPY